MGMKGGGERERILGRKEIEVRWRDRSRTEMKRCWGGGVILEPERSRGEWKGYWDRREIKWKGEDTGTEEFSSDRERY